MNAENKRIGVVVMLTLLVYFSLVMVWSARDPSRNRVEHPINIVADDTSILSFNPDLPFNLEFGRGSGLSGLATVKLATNGAVTVTKRDIILETVKAGKYEPVWATSHFEIKQRDVEQISKAIKELALCDLDKAYHDRNIADGTQWVFYLRQNGRKKAVYFNNYFPKSILRFSTLVDQTLEPYTKDAEWKEITVAEANLAGRSLWDSIK